jgi:hypothetical protein
MTDAERRALRERLIRTGQIMPRPDDPEEREWHECWKKEHWLLMGDDPIPLRQKKAV